MTYLCLALLLVLAGIFYLVNRNTGVQASDDPLSAGMVVADILAKWETPAADMQARFDAVIDAQLADASTTQADAALIEAARPTLDESWVCFSLQSEDDPNDVILLAYQSATHVMIVAEQQK